MNRKDRRRQAIREHIREHPGTRPDDVCTGVILDGAVDCTRNFLALASLVRRGEVVIVAQVGASCGCVLPEGQRRKQEG